MAKLKVPTATTEERKAAVPVAGEILFDRTNQGFYIGSDEVKGGKRLVTTVDIESLPQPEISGNELRNIENFRRHWLLRDKDLTIVGVGTSLTQHTSGCRELPDASRRPPLLDRRNFCSLIWEKIKWDGQEYFRYDAPDVFTEATPGGSDFQTVTGLGDTKDGTSGEVYIRSTVRAIYADTEPSVSFYIEQGIRRCNFIYSQCINAAREVKVTIGDSAEGDSGLVEVYDDRETSPTYGSWIEANGYTFSQYRAEVFASNIRVADPQYKTNAVVTKTSYKIGGNETYQKRLKLRCKSDTTIDSTALRKKVTIRVLWDPAHFYTGWFNYWGIEQSKNDHIISYICSSRGSHGMGVDQTRSLLHYEESEVWPYKPDLLLVEMPIYNSGLGNPPYTSYYSNYWRDIAYDFLFNMGSELSYAYRAKLHNLDCEYIVFNGTFGTSGSLVDESGLVQYKDADGRQLNALDILHETLASLSYAKAVVLLSETYWSNAALQLFGDYYTALSGSVLSGQPYRKVSMTYDGTHWNEVGSAVMAKCVGTVFDRLLRDSAPQPLVDLYDGTGYIAHSQNTGEAYLRKIEGILFRKASDGRWYGELGGAPSYFYKDGNTWHMQIGTAIQRNGVKNNTLHRLYFQQASGDTYGSLYFDDPDTVAPYPAFCKITLDPVVDLYTINKTDFSFGVEFLADALADKPFNFSVVIQSASSGVPVTWPDNVVWLNGEPDVSAVGTTIVSFYYDGVSFYGSIPTSGGGSSYTFGFGITVDGGTASLDSRYFESTSMPGISLLLHEAGVANEAFTITGEGKLVFDGETTEEFGAGDIQRKLVAGANITLNGNTISVNDDGGMIELLKQQFVFYHKTGEVNLGTLTVGYWKQSGYFPLDWTFGEWGHFGLLLRFDNWA